MTLLRWTALLLALAWLATVALARRSLTRPLQCEVEVVPVGGERLRARCWCDGRRGE